MTPNAAGYAQTLLRHVLTNVSSLTKEQFDDAGTAARNLLAFAWRQEVRNSWLVTTAIRSVCITIRSDVQESGDLLRRALEPDHLSNYGYEEATHIAMFASDIAAVYPELAAQIYSSIFNYEEKSTSKTDMSSSRILSMTSNRRQDYNHSKWELAQRYPRLLEASLFHAARAMVSVAESCAASEREPVSSSRPAVPFKVADKQAGIVEDYSYIWDGGSHAGKENEMQIIDSFFRELSERTKNPDHGDEVPVVLAFLIAGVRPGIVWRRLLKLGVEQPHTVGLKIKQVTTAAPLLKAIDTQDDAEDLIAVVYPLLDEDDRASVEQSILSLPEGAEARVRDRLVAQRDRIIRSLPRELLTTQSACDLLAELEARRFVPEKRIPRQPMRVTAGTVDEAFFLEQVIGVSASSEPHKALLALQQPVQRFLAQYSNANPPLNNEAILASLPDLRALKTFVDSPPSGTDERVVAMGCGTLANACATIAGSDTLDCKSEAGVFVLETLLALSTHPEPQHDPKYDDSFDRNPSWGAPLPRIEAADGLIKAARFPSCFEKHSEAAIERLLKDPAPAVRFQIATRLGCLYKTANELMWQLVERVASEEQSNAVLETLGHVLNDLRAPHPERVAKICLKIFERLGTGAGSERCRETYVTVLTFIAVWQGIPEASDFLLNLVASPLRNADALGTILRDLREAIAIGASEQKARARALNLFSKIVDSAYTEYIRCIEICRGGRSNEGDRDALQKMVELLGEASNQLYFGSGVFDRAQSHGPEPAHEQKQLFYTAVAQVVDTLSATGLPGPTQHLVEMVEALIAVDPKRIFLQISRMVESGRLWGYEFESMAAELIVRIVERYLADYRHLLQHDIECRIALRTLLDTFVEAGWPAAQQLSYRLDEIFR